jgi:hypothetical protein
MIQNHWRRITHHDSQPLAQHDNPWFTATGVANHVVLCWASGCESLCAILSQWLWIMMCCAEPVVVNDGVECWASGSESWDVILSQWLWIKVCYTELLFANYDELCWASECEPWCVILCQWLWIVVCYAEPVVINNHWLSITHHNSHPLAQHYTPWITTTGSA